MNCSCCSTRLTDTRTRATSRLKATSLSYWQPSTTSTHRTGYIISFRPYFTLPGLLDVLICLVLLRYMGPILPYPKPHLTLTRLIFFYLNLSWRTCLVILYITFITFKLIIPYPATQVLPFRFFCLTFTKLAYHTLPWHYLGLYLALSYRRFTGAETWPRWSSNILQREEGLQRSETLWRVRI